ncbi:4Fe-4S dicluster domain-containing protein [Carboxylicivirga sp. N1Y90]|uniref:4Fe-4S dicluster domain-containing protein n=1 Tax=Carboxylicivirga fragile TaxID=3417571 RepID=UPI003D32AC77|nr:4Fe-4S binding protein [Marinilabiliaceae bacterium N1Y90]
MEKNAFIFNTNKCVGCMACVAGCSIENGTTPQLNWRVVNGHNKIKHPGLPVFHFSLACNHCDDAPCMKNCPALAYTRDKDTGAIIHHAEACIGCTYCTWACPYDAPKFNETTKVVEKCNFCVDRISDGKKPACAQACPVGALDFSFDAKVDYKNHLSPGFVNMGIKPSINLIPLREEHRKPTIENSDAIKFPIDIGKYQEKPPSKVELKKEWPLVLFTLAASLLVAWQAANLITGVSLPALLFFSIAASAIFLTSMHVGKKLRLWRFILNLKGSWLSREIFAFSAFLGLGGLALLLKESNIQLFEHKVFDPKTIGYLALLFGSFTLISIDMVYKFFRRKDSIKLHSALISITGPFLFAWFTQSLALIIAFTLIKLSLYLVRKVYLDKQKAKSKHWLTLTRIALLLLPLAALIDYPSTPLWYLLPIILLGEVIDRSEFYTESEIITPQGTLNELSLESN